MALPDDEGILPAPGAESGSLSWTAAILEATPDAIVVVGPDDAIVTVNAQAERLFGYPRQRLVGQPLELLLPDSHRVRQASHRAAGAADAADPRTRPMGVGLDLSARRENGDEFPVEISLSPLATPDGLYVVSAIHDLSERQQAERDRANLATIVEASGDAIVGTTLDGIVTSWNPAAERLFGYSAAEMIGRPIDTLSPPGDIDEISHNIAALRRGETIRNRETTCSRKDGSGLDIALTISPVRAPDETIIGAAAISRDIARRKQAEATARDFAEQLRRAFHSAAIGMALVAPDGAFLQVNRALTEMLGYSEEEMLATTFQQLTHPEDLAADLALTRRLLAGEIPSYILEKRYLRRDGPVVWGRLSASLVRDDHGEPLYFVSQVQDITATREVERLKDEFVATVSHELRTPLTSIAGFVDLLLEGAGGEISPEMEHYLTVVRRNSQRLIALVNDLLDISRIEAGKIELHREAVDLPQQLRDLIAAFTPQIAGKRQTVQLVLPECLPPLWADSERSAQIFTNLISNACKYTPAGGAITITAGRAEDAVWVEVADNGFGIPEEDQPHLFTRFFRASHRAAREEGGTGLGLPITRALVELHGGSLSVQSAPGVGSTFRVTLPTTLLSCEAAAMVERGVEPAGRGNRSAREFPEALVTRRIRGTSS
ncbi:MAG: PAS domain S-box protein [Thermomicrobiales bacterium]|nr:PAS domain S-box protein [Thermomicrobiales bacterium]